MQQTHPFGVAGSFLRHTQGGAAVTAALEHFRGLVLRQSLSGLGLFEVRVFSKLPAKLFFERY